MIKSLILSVMIATMLAGCGQEPMGRAVIVKANQQSHTDVSEVPYYNFQSFAGTVWKTKVKVALALAKTYKGDTEVHIIPPQYYDDAHPEYVPSNSLIKIVAVLPVDTTLRIEKLMKDNGSWGGVQVTASIIGESTSIDPGTILFLNWPMLAHNRYTSSSFSKSNEWGIAPEMLEKAEK